MRCLECNKEVTHLDNKHLGECSGLTLQEYALRHHKSLDLLVEESMVGVPDNTANYSLPSSEPAMRSQSVLSALMLVDAFEQEQDFCVLNNEVRRLDQLLWYLRELQVYGFQFRQEYSYTDTSHRVIANNCIKTLNAYTHKFSPSNVELNFELYTAVVVAQVGQVYSDYVFLSLPESEIVQKFLTQLTGLHQIRWVKLNSYDNSGGVLYRTESLEDAQRLLKLVEPHLQEIPCACDRFYAETAHAVVSKELVFDSAHFITDHPGKCENMHGGRYNLQVKVAGRVDPLTGFVIDYGYLKSVVKQRVINRLDHQTLNYASADLGWRSSTELLNIFIWEQLIDYLPGLYELQTYETTQSYCVYRGPSLEQMQKGNKVDVLKHFSQPELGKSLLRKMLRKDERKELKIVSQ